METNAQTNEQIHGDEGGVDLGRFDPYSDTHMFERMDAYDKLRERGASFRSEAYEGFWILTRGEAMREALQNPTLFSSKATVPSDPSPDYQWLPLMLDPPLHTRWRQLIGASFSPGAVERLEPRMRARAVELIDGLVDGGRCDFVKDFAREYPTRVFMELMGLPTDRLEQFMEWEDRIVNYSSESDPDRSKMYQAMGDVRSFFKELLDARRDAPRDDLVSAALTWELDGGPIPQDDLLNFCLLMFMAGLDTVTQQLAYIFGHLARNPADRRAIAADDALIPSAVEEFLRYYSIVTVGRRVMKDTTFQGCPMKAGEIVFMPLTCATRDDRQFDDADVVRIDREVNRHAAFGLGPHRCLGSHLARAELVIALEEWHRRIPDYRLDGIEPHEIVEHSGGGVLGVDRLPLVWT